MSLFKKGLFSLLALALISLMSGCSPKVGSDAWCDMMKDKPKGEWTANEAGDFTKYCVLGMHDDK